MNSNPTSLDVVQIVVYGILILPTNYCLFRHGKMGILGWLSLSVFCTIRLVAMVIDIVESKSSSSTPTVTLVVENIGLSPLMLGTMGIIHEARHRLRLITNSRNEWIYVIFFHGAVALSMVLVIVGLVHLTNPDPSATSTNTGTMKGGFIILLVTYIHLTLWTFWSLANAGAYTPYLFVLASDNLQRNTTVPGGSGLRQWTTLLYAALLTLPCILLRGIYGAVSLFSSVQSDPRDPYQQSSFAASLAANVCMNVLPQLLAGIFLSVSGLLTLGLPSVERKQPDGPVPLTSAQYDGSQGANTETTYQSYQA